MKRSGKESISTINIQSTILAQSQSRKQFILTRFMLVLREIINLVSQKPHSWARLTCLVFW